ncbi:ABC transporter ATP-binding protein [Peptoniphilus obesi]|uniref:ABC transporter ATP-binding protein n=1 Tax=Peptoniphilus obesi TaxID=1472765 RepID=UPI0004B382D3|nr:ABC transporter ATP-binding protein [Peptoniphilus obesi]
MSQKKTKAKITSPENIKALKKIMSLFFKESKFKFIFIVFLVLFSGFVGILPSIFLKILIDEYIIPMMQMANPSFAPLFKLLSIFGLIYFAGVSATFIYSRMMINISENILKDLRSNLFRHMEFFPISYFDNRSHGDIMSVYTNDISTLQQLMTNTIPGLLSSIVTLVAVIVAMIITSPVLFIVVIVSVIVLLYTLNNVGGKSSEYYFKLQQSLGKQNGFVEETIDGQKVIKVFSHEENIIKDFEKINTELAKNTTLANRYSLFLLPIVFNIGNLQYAFLAIIGGLFAINGSFGITIGTIASYLQLSKVFSGPIRNISQQMNMVASALGGSIRIFDMLDVEKEIDDGFVELISARYDQDNNLVEVLEESEDSFKAWKNTKTGEIKKLRGEIIFDHVSFSYDGKNTVLHDISIHAKPGQKIALVGETGAGKTTITNLLNRFYEIDSGKITYDGIDIKDIKKKDLRSSLGIVLQDINLFTGSINYNLAYGVGKIDQEEIIDSAKKSQAHDFISLLPDGYDTMISGTNLDISQGQAQLLSIARTEIYDPAVLILDEATSSIDSRTEKLVQDSMDQVMKGRTSFVIAHRLSTVKNSDAIIVLSKGRIIERGNHEELLEQKGVYYKLYTGGFEDN